MGTKLRVVIDLEREMDEERLKPDDLVELLCSDSHWAKVSLSVESREKLAKLVTYLNGGRKP